ncbi:MAG: histidinol phosphate phosphatase domain-containing protein [Armatimonadetes bacterium]|nr:histidinol phosphate phosphatase domain-containing protein [Armatimonadota bacterium]
MLYDFHMHTFLSDGELLPTELIRRCVVNGYTAMATADHISDSTAERVIREAKRDAELGMRCWDIEVLTGGEITHVPAAGIAEVAERAIAAGAEIIVVHGETIVEPVEPGTNRAAILSGKVDILAHPGLLDPEDAKLAAEREVFLEISCRKGHSLGNGRVVQLGREAGAKFLLNTDSHMTGDLLTEKHAIAVAFGAGLTKAEAQEVLYENPRLLLDRVRRRRSK